MGMCSTEETMKLYTRQLDEVELKYCEEKMVQLQQLKADLKNFYESFVPPSAYRIEKSPHDRWTATYRDKCVLDTFNLQTAVEEIIKHRLKNSLKSS